MAKRKIEIDQDNIIERIPLPPKPMPPLHSAHKIHSYTLDFLNDLAGNNNREWFNINKNRYEAAHENVIAFAGELIQRLSLIDVDLVGLEPKQCLMRIYRDVRFAADKTPYKTCFSMTFKREGKKSPFGGYYVQIGVESMVGGGMWAPPSPLLSNIRRDLIRENSPLHDLLNHQDIATQFGMNGRDLIISRATSDGLVLKTKPTGFPANSPQIDLLKLKSFALASSMKRDLVLSDDFLDSVVAQCSAIAPLVHYLNNVAF